jgi:hypothetical protein
MSYRFHPEAEVELNVSIDYYESIEPAIPNLTPRRRARPRDR